MVTGWDGLVVAVPGLAYGAGAADDDVADEGVGGAKGGFAGGAAEGAVAGVAEGRSAGGDGG